MVPLLKNETLRPESTLTVTYGLLGSSQQFGNSSGAMAPEPFVSLLEDGTGEWQARILYPEDTDYGSSNSECDSSKALQPTDRAVKVRFLNDPDSGLVQALIDGDPDLDASSKKAKAAATLQRWLRSQWRQRTWLEMIRDYADYCKLINAVRRAQAEEAARREVLQPEEVGEPRPRQLPNEGSDVPAFQSSLSEALWSKTLSLDRSRLSSIYRACAYTDGTMEVHQFCMLLDKLGISGGTGEPLRRKAALDLFASLDTHADGYIRQVCNQASSLPCAHAP